MSAPVIVHARVPDFYAAAERARHPELRGRPLIVGGDPRRGGRVQSATADAAAAGVLPGMAVIEALERCPRARPLRTDMKHYRELSAAFQACLRDAVELVEPDGLGAAYLDASRLPGDPEALGASLRDRVRDELGLPLQVGIAPVKVIARLAALEAGEPGVLRVRPGEEQGFLDPLPIERLPQVGPKALAWLHERGARHVGELRRLEAAAVEEALGARGRSLLEYARGRDSATVRPAAGPQSASQGLTLAEAAAGCEALADPLDELAARLEEALARHRVAGRRIALRVRYDDGDSTSRSQTFERGLSSADEIARVAGELLARTEVETRPARSLRLTVSGISHGVSDSRQLDLFSEPA